MFTADTAPGAKVTPLDQIIVKSSSLCNIDCSYCYMYRLTENSREFWKKQPRHLSREVMEIFAQKYRRYCDLREVTHPSIIFHGGEPLLATPELFESWLTLLENAFEGSGINLGVGVQSNGLLFNRNYAEQFRRWGVTVGISVDGVPGKHDLLRTDFQGQPTGQRAEPTLELLRGEYRDIFSGLLCVINVRNDPIEVLEYLLQWSPPSIDFLLPLDTYDRRPFGKENVEATPYGDWLIAIFDYLLDRKIGTRIRSMDLLVQRALSEYNVGTLFGDTWDVVCLRADGQVEVLDTFLASDIGVRDIGINILNSEFSDVEDAVKRIAPQMEQMLQPSDACQRCELLSICGGGIYHSRFSEQNRFQRPSVFCSDMKKLISHALARLS